MAISATTTAVRSRAGAGASSGSSWLSDGVAPAPAVTRSDKEDAVEAGLEAHSSLPLQVCLYFHKYFFVVWFIVTLRLTRSAYDDTGEGGVWGGGSFETILYILLYLLEPITLALGYFGNLSERTSVLAGFALLSITLKFLSVLYLMLTTKVVMLIVIHGTLGAFHLVEAVLSAIAMESMSRHETAHRIVLQPSVSATQFGDDEDDDDNGIDGGTTRAFMRVRESQL